MLLSRSTEFLQASPYIYRPTLWLAVAGAVAFVLVTVIHTVLFLRGKTWFFWPLVVGALMESVGFVARARSAHDLTEPYSFVVGYLALILAPSFLAAACYVAFGRIVWWVAPAEDRNVATLWCPPRLITAIFVFFDLGAFFIQFLGACSVGAAYSSRSLTAGQKEDKTQSGLSTLRLGLVLQLICFGLFAIVGMRLLVVSRRWLDKPLRYGAPRAKWTRLNWTVNGAATVIMVRAIYRMLEFTAPRGDPGYLQSHEWPFWLFDALPMLVVLIAFIVVHPVQYLPQEFLCLTLNKRRILQIEASSPPSYIQAWTDHDRAETIQLEAVTV